MLAQIEKHKSKMDNPLKIDTEDISVYGEMPIDMLVYGTNWIARNEGSQTAKRRQKNIVIFNSDKKEKIHIRFNCNARVLNNDIVDGGLHFEKEGKDIIFCIEDAGIDFRKVELYDAVNDIRYIFKLVIRQK